MKINVKKNIRRLLRKTQTFFLIALYLVVSFAFISILISVFSVREIVVDGTSDIRGMGVLSNRLIFLIDSKKAESILYNQNPGIEKISLTKIYPNKIILRIKKSNIAAFLKTGNRGLFLNENGRILKKVKDNNPQGVPIISYYQELVFDQYSTGDTIDFDEITASLYLLNRIKQVGIQIDTVDIGSFDVLLLKNRISEYYFSVSKNRDLQYKQFRSIIKKYKIEGKQIKRLDLRFNKPIVTEN